MARDGALTSTPATVTVHRMEGDTVVLQDIFQFVEKGVDTQGNVIGEMKPTGMRPKFITRLEQAGFALPPEVFGAESFPPRRK